MIESDATKPDDGYKAALAEMRNLGRFDGIDGLLRKYHPIDAILIPTSLISSIPPAMASYPIVTVPLGFMPPDHVAALPANPAIVKAPGLPFGMSITRTLAAFSEFKLISYAYAYEQATQTRLKRLAYPGAVPRTQSKDVVGNEHQG